MGTSRAPSRVLIITPAERAALELLARESPAHEIADALGVRGHAIDAALATLFAKFGAASPATAVAAAFRRGVLVRQVA